jgi:hypothetical protein
VGDWWAGRFRSAIFAREKDGTAFGIIAIGMAMVAIILGKFLGVSLFVQDLQKSIDAIQVTITEQDMVNNLASDVAKDWKAKGKAVASSANDELSQKYNPAVMAEAQKRWKAVPAVEKAKQMAELKASVDEAKTNFGSSARSSGFSGMFSPFDIIWFLLAAITAFKLGSGMATSD